MSAQRDILLELEQEIPVETVYCSPVAEEKIYETICFKYTPVIKQKQVIVKKSPIISGAVFLTKYILTSGFIFAILLGATNYSAYYSIAKSIIFKSETQQQAQGLINSVEAANIKAKYIQQEEPTFLSASQRQEKSESLSIRAMKKDQDKVEIPLDIEITPYENRIIIPKIGKNIPLLEVKDQKVDNQKQLNDIFMKELEGGIVRYPSSAKPGQDGTSFIFGHSSNFPWMDGEYNDVFATLDNVEFDDEIIVYYGQKKHTYKIREKKVISPGDVGVLKRDKGKKEITLMTCWPIGTTLNRLIVTGELVE